jgi:hypothetical protein
MTAELINLRRARKAKQRAEEDLRAAANRARFGREKSAHEAQRAEAARAVRELEGKKLQD